MSENLKPCPFCGESNAFVERADYVACYVQCNGCCAQGPIKCQESDDEETPGRDAAIAAWNRRAPSASAQQAEPTDWTWCYENPHEAAREIDRLRAAPAPSASPAALTDDRIREIARNYAQFVSPGVYDITRFECEDDMLGFVRALLAASPADQVVRTCNACAWCGPESDCVYCGSVGPLCPKCNETTDAADRVEDTRDAAWIPVDERLPEPETDVLVRGVSHSSRQFDIAGLFHGKWMSHVTQEDCKIDVTHWRAIDAAMSASKEG